MWLATPHNRQMVKFFDIFVGGVTFGWREKNGYVIQASELHGCKFPGSLYCTQTKTDGNAIMDRS